MADDLNKEATILGRPAKDIEKYGEKGTAYLGKVVISSGEQPVLGRKVLVDLAKPHLILICGKRGGGKSYSMAVLIEEFARLDPVVKSRVAVIVIDMVGIFWSLKFPDKLHESELADWDLKASASPVNVFVPQGKLSFYKEKGIPVDGPFTIKASELSGIEWMALFQLTWKDAEGILITRVIEQLQEKLGTYYGLDEVIAAVRKDEESEPLTRQALINRLHVAKEWGLIEKSGTKIRDISRPGSINIIDVSAYRQAIGMEGTKDIIVALIGKKLFEERMLFRKEEEAKIIRGEQRTSDMPIVWMMIDEAHMFMPKDEDNIALRILLEWIRVGRQPGLSLVLATQRPERLHPDAISQCDIFISHRMTAQDDIKAVSLLRPSYLHSDFDKLYQEMPRTKGYAIVLDDNTEKLWLIKVRPRFSWDAGVTASAFLE
ncbi:MAG: ATP-binding protein [Candidatus Diapherotrites archaeon]|nr:ATP-binding protein [Candidatus Diapherotrites archaeon]